MNFSSELFNRLELLLSSIGIILGIFSGIFLLINRYKKANVFLAVYVLALSLRMLKSLFHDFYVISSQALTLFLGLLLIVGPSLFFYATYLYKTNYSIKPIKYYIHYIPFLVLICINWFLPNTYGTTLKLIYFGFFLHGLMYCFFTLYLVLKVSKSSADLSKDKGIKKWLLAMVFATIIFFVNSILILLDIVPYYPSGAYLFSFCICF